MQTVGLVQPALDAAARLNGVVQAANVAAGLVDATVQLAALTEASKLAAATEATASAVSGNARYVSEAVKTTTSQNPRHRVPADIETDAAIAKAKAKPTPPAPGPAPRGPQCNAPRPPQASVSTADAGLEPELRKGAMVSTNFSRGAISGDHYGVRRKSPLATKNLLEVTDGLRRPPF